MNKFLLGGWVARPRAFYLVAFLCLPCLFLSGLSGLRGLRGRSVFCCRLACTWSQCSAWLHFVARVPVLNLTALCRLCLFLVGLAFPHRLTNTRRFNYIFI